MSLQSQLDEADLQKRSSELSAREEGLNAREAILRDSQAELETLYKVLDSKVVIRQKQLEKIETDIENKQNVLDIIDADYEHNKHALNTKAAELRTSVKKLESDIEQAKHALKIQKDALTETNNSVNERKQYLKDQEDTITVAIVEWNDQLNAIKYEADKVEKDKSTALGTSITLEQEIVKLTDDYETELKKLDQIKYSYEEKARDYRRQLQEQAALLERKKNEIAEAETNHQMREQSLVAREKTIKVQEIALDKTNRQLQADRRRFESSQSLFS